MTENLSQLDAPVLMTGTTLSENSLPEEPFVLEPYKLPIKTCRFHKIISDLNPFFLLIIRLQEQYSDTARCWIWQQYLLLSK